MRHIEINTPNLDALSAGLRQIGVAAEAAGLALRESFSDLHYRQRLHRERQRGLAFVRACAIQARNELGLGR